MIDTAIAFAAMAHAGQKRKYTGDPYIVHPIEVMQLVRRYQPKREDMAIAAILHDVIEDTPVTHREIDRRFGPNIMRMVVGLTEVEIEGNRAVRKASERDRLAKEAADVQTIKVCDIISNTSTIVKHDPKFAKVYIPEAKELMRVLTKAHPEARAYANASLRPL